MYTEADDLTVIMNSIKIDRFYRMHDERFGARLLYSS